MRSLLGYFLLSAVFCSSGSCLNYSTSGPLRINVNQIPLSERQLWCESQFQTCSNICALRASPANPNDCVPDTLKWQCVCTSGFHPNISSYSGTVPSFICQTWVSNCVANHANDPTGQLACASVVCGSKDASPSTTSSPSGSATSSSSSSSSAQQSTNLAPNQPTTGSGSTKTTSGSTKTGTISNLPQSSTSSTSSANSSSSGLSTGAEAGIGVGVGLGGILLITLLILLLRKRKREPQEGTRPEREVSERPSPWPSLRRRFWGAELHGQDHRPELGGSDVRPEMPAEQRAPELSAGPRSPTEPYELRGDAVRSELVGEPTPQSGFDRSNAPS